MGNAACRCECIKQDEAADPVVRAQALSPFEEEVTIRAPTVAQATYSTKVRKDAPAPVPHFSEQNLASQPAPQPHAPEVVPAPTPKPPTKVEAKVEDPGVCRAIFELEADKPLGVVFAEVNNPEPNGTLVVTSVAEDSPLFKPTSGDRGVQPGDVVIEVNGQGGPKSTLLKTLRQARNEGGKLELMLRVRPATFEVHLVRGSEDEKMGVVAAIHDEVADRLEVRHICEQGALPSWNEEHPTMQVVGGDWIISVNGSQTASNELIGAMQSAWIKGGELKFEIKTNLGAMTP